MTEMTDRLHINEACAAVILRRGDAPPGVWPLCAGVNDNHTLPYILLYCERIITFMTMWSLIRNSLKFQNLINPLDY